MLVGAEEHTYVSDAGSACGAGSVPGSPLGGVGIVAGREVAESMTDLQLNGWFDARGSQNGEIGDKCAWSGLGTIHTGAGTFALQPLWSNRTNGCVLASSTSNLLAAGSFEYDTTGRQRLVLSPGAIVHLVNYNTAGCAPASAYDGTGYLAFNTDAGTPASRTGTPPGCRGPLRDQSVPPVV